MPRVDKKTAEVSVEHDDVYDEVDHFHMQRDGELLNSSSNKRIKVGQKEVLSVRVEDSEESEDDEEVPAAQSNEMEVPISTNKWGKKRAGYYGASYVDKDFGGVNDSEEEEMLELEEEDAISRQKKLDSANNYVDLDFGMESKDDSSDVDSSGAESGKETRPALKRKIEAKELAKMSTQEQLKYFVGQDDQLDTWIREYEERKEEIQHIVEPLAKILAKIKSVDCKLKRQLAAVVTTYQQYACNIILYLFLKIDTPLAKLRSLQTHPIHDDLLKFKKFMEKADNFLAENGRSLSKMIEQFNKCPEEFVDLVAKQALKKTQPINKSTTDTKNKVQFAADAEEEMDMQEADTKELLTENEKRGITYEMQKNKGLTAKRKKGTEHARVKKRKQYDKALIRRRSQVPDVRREMIKYDGEKRGIRASTIRSIKLQ